MIGRVRAHSATEINVFTSSSSRCYFQVEANSTPLLMLCYTIKFVSETESVITAFWLNLMTSLRHLTRATGTTKNKVEDTEKFTK